MWKLKNNADKDGVLIVREAVRIGGSECLKLCFPVDFDVNLKTALKIKSV